MAFNATLINLNNGMHMLEAGTEKDKKKKEKKKKKSHSRSRSPTRSNNLSIPKRGHNRSESESEDFSDAEAVTELQHGLRREERGGSGLGLQDLND
jgi:hypothetical protein